MDVQDGWDGLGCVGVAGVLVSGWGHPLRLAALAASPFAERKGRD